MIIKIELPDEIESKVILKATQAGLSTEDYVCKLLIEIFVDQPPVRQKLLPKEGFGERLDAWVKLHPVLDHPINDDRETFYEGRG